MQRRFFFGSGAATLVAGALGSLGAVLRFLFPGVLYEPPSRFPVGFKEDFAPGTGTFVPEHRVFVFNTPEGFYCVSAVCTHLGCNVRVDEPRGLSCPCHGSVFDREGAVSEGPAPRPLECYALSLSRRGELVADRAQPVDPRRRFRL